MSTCSHWAATVGVAIWYGVKTGKSCSTATFTSASDFYADFKCIEDCVHLLKIAEHDKHKVIDCIEAERKSSVSRKTADYSCHLTGCGHDKLFFHRK
jgi:hypothetical protein